MEPQQVPGGEAVSLPPYLVIAHGGHNILYPRAGGTPEPGNQDTAWNGRFSAETQYLVVGGLVYATSDASFSWGPGAQGKPGSNSGAHPRSSGWWSFLLLPVPARKPPPMGPGGGFGRDGAAPFGLSALLRPLVVPLAVVG